MALKWWHKISKKSVEKAKKTTFTICRNEGSWEFVLFASDLKYCSTLSFQKKA